MGASSLLQLNLQKHELHIAHNPLTQDIHNTLISLYSHSDLISIMLSPQFHNLGDKWSMENSQWHSTRSYSPLQPTSQRKRTNNFASGAFIRFTSIAGTSWPMVADLTFSNVQCSPDQWLESSIFLLELLDLHVGPLAFQPPKHFWLNSPAAGSMRVTSDRSLSTVRTKF